MKLPIIYVAFLRGVNVGGKMVKMELWRKTLEEMGFSQVKTLLNSGNVVFESSEANVKAIKQKIEKELKETFGFPIAVTIRTKPEIDSLIATDPFKGIKVTANTRLYVTFLAEKSNNQLKTPYQSLDDAFKILSISDTEIISVLTLSPDKKTTDAMNILEKELGIGITTRNWNTVLKVGKLMVD